MNRLHEDRKTYSKALRKQADGLRDAAEEIERMSDAQWWAAVVAAQQCGVEVILRSGEVFSRPPSTIAG